MRREAIMALALNKVYIAGNVVRDPQLRYTSDGTAVCDLTVAINYMYKKSSGEFQKETCFLEVEAWRKNAEISAEHLKKGSPVIVVGRLKQDDWTDKEGNKRSKIKVLAERIQPLLKVSGETENAESQTPPEE